MKLSSKVNDSVQKENHILKVKTGCHLASHHLISYQLFYRLTTERINQMEAHNYSWNNGSNIVLLPHDGGSAISKAVACYYNLPFHSSAHQGIDISNHWDSTKKKEEVNNDLLGSNSKQSNGKAGQAHE